MKKVIALLLLLLVLTGCGTDLLTSYSVRTPKEEQTTLPSCFWCDRENKTTEKGNLLTISVQ